MTGTGIYAITATTTTTTTGGGEATTRTIITITATTLRLRVRHSIAPTTLVRAMTTDPASTTQQAQAHRQVVLTRTSTATA